MNYFSKYVKKFSTGGNVDLSNLNAAAEAFQADPEVFMSAADSTNDDNARELVSNLNELLSNGDIEGAQNLLAEGENAEMLINLYAYIESASKSTPAAQLYKNGGQVEYLSYLKCGGKPDCGCKSSKKTIKAEEGTNLPEKNGFFSKIVERLRGPKTVNGSSQTTGKVVYINTEGYPFRNQSAAPGPQYQKPYGIVYEDGSTSWKQNVADVGPLSLSGKEYAKSMILDNRGIYVPKEN